MYHPTLGQWISRDPIGYGDGMNVYGYTKSAPVQGTDPAGLANAEYARELEVQEVFESLRKLVAGEFAKGKPVKTDVLERELLNAEKLARAYVAAVHEYRYSEESWAARLKADPNKEDLRAGFLCYQWAIIVRDALNKANVDADSRLGWAIVGNFPAADKAKTYSDLWVRDDATLNDSWVIVYRKDPSYSKELLSASVQLNPWRGVGTPVAYAGKDASHWNWITLRTSPIGVSAQVQAKYPKGTWEVAIEGYVYRDGYFYTIQKVEGRDKLKRTTRFRENTNIPLIPIIYGYSPRKEMLWGTWFSPYPLLGPASAPSK